MPELQQQGPPKALDDIRVLDISTSFAGAWCSRVLADLGADVIAIEPRAGHPLRTLAPHAEDGTSIPAMYALANKRSLSLDVDSERGRQYFVELVQHADVVVDSTTPGTLEEWGIDYARLDARRKGIILASITPHGQTGDLSRAPGNDLTAFARSGWASINGLGGQAPLNGSAFQASYNAGVAGAAGVLGALHHRAEHPEEGQHVDIAETEVMASAFAPALLRGQYGGDIAPRKTSIDMTSGPVPVKDGYFALTISRAHFWRDAMNLLGLHDLAEDERYETSWYRQQHRDEYVSRVQEQMAGWTKMELFEELAIRRVVAGPVLTMQELSENEHLRDRGFWVIPSDAPEAPTYPGAPFQLSKTPWTLARRMPRPGEHTVEVLRELLGTREDQMLTLVESGVIGPEGHE